MQAEVRWEQREVRVMGRTCAQPRLIAYQADHPGLRYTYSGLQLTPEAWSPAVRAIKVPIPYILYHIPYPGPFLNSHG